METIVPASDSIPSRSDAIAASRFAQGRKKLVRFASTRAISPPAMFRSSGSVSDRLKIRPICNINGIRMTLPDGKLRFDTDFHQIYHPRRMGQRIAAIIFLLSFARFAHSADPKVATVVPAATDLIISMGAGDHLVGISNYDDSARPELKTLPKIGDYQTIDWEKLRALKPNILITFQSPDRISPGVKERAARLNLKLVNIRTETLADIFTELKNLGQLLGEEEKATQAAKKLQKQLDDMRQRLRNLAPVKTLLLRDESVTATVGRDNFLNDILELAGGQNVIEDSGWPTIDRERLTNLNPDAIIILLANVPPQVEKQAAANIQRMAHLTAVKNNRVKIINTWYAQQPGLHLGDLADQFAKCLHPE